MFFLNRWKYKSLDVKIEHNDKFAEVSNDDGNDSEIIHFHRLWIDDRSK